MSNQTPTAWQCKTLSSGPNSIDRITFYFANVREAMDGARRMARLFRRPVQLKFRAGSGVYVSWYVPWIIRIRLEEHFKFDYPHYESIDRGPILWVSLAKMTNAKLLTILRDEEQADQVLLEDYETDEEFERGLYGFPSGITYDETIDLELRQEFGLRTGPINEVIEEFCRSITNEDDCSDGIPF